tara:strand:+ start:17600 stop:17878 length:279 start_codon:yes stop_codon:yes gene_type:complete
MPPKNNWMNKKGSCFDAMLNKSIVRENAGIAIGSIADVIANQIGYHVQNLKFYNLKAIRCAHIERWVRKICNIDASNFDFFPFLSTIALHGA